MSGREGVVFSSRKTYIYDKMHKGLQSHPSLLLLRVPRNTKPGLPFIFSHHVIISVVFWVETVHQELKSESRRVSSLSDRV